MSVYLVSYIILIDPWHRVDPVDFDASPAIRLICDEKEIIWPGAHVEQRLELTRHEGEWREGDVIVSVNGLDLGAANLAQALPKDTSTYEFGVLRAESRAAPTQPAAAALTPMDHPLAALPPCPWQSSLPGQCAELMTSEPSK